MTPFETVLYGVREGFEDWAEEILSTRPESFEEVKALAAKHGFGRFRIARIDLRTQPDFARTVVGVRRRGGAR